MLLPSGVTAAIAEVREGNSEPTNELRSCTTDKLLFPIRRRTSRLLDDGKSFYNRHRSDIANDL